MAGKKKLTYESLRGMKEKPKSIDPSQYESSRVPSGYKICSDCGHFVRGPQTKICPNCGSDISPAKRERKAGRSSKSGLGLNDYNGAQSLIETMGGLDETQELIKTLEQLGGLEAAKAAVDAWASLIEATGSEERAQATLTTLHSSGALN